VPHNILIKTIFLKIYKRCGLEVHFIYKARFRNNIIKEDGICKLSKDTLQYKMLKTNNQTKYNGRRQFFIIRGILAYMQWNL